MEEKDAEVYSCPGCGGVMGFDIARQMFLCPNCGNEASLNVQDAFVQEYDYLSHIAGAGDDAWADATEIWRCESCGAEITIERNATTAQCAYCASAHVLKARQGEGVRPEAIVPFQVDRHAAGERFRKWISGKWFAPGALKTLYQQDKLQPVYLPYWTYDADATARYTGQGGKVYYVTVGSGDKKRQERRVRWYPVSGTVQNAFDDVLVSAKQAQDPLEKKASAFNTGACVPFDMAYLSGYQAEKYTIGVEDGFSRARTIMEDTLRSLARDEILRRYDEAQVHHLSARYDNIRFKHVLLPLWMSGYYYKEKLYRFLINGQTGKVTGKYPLSGIKVGLAIAAGLILAAAVFLWIYTGQGA